MFLITLKFVREMIQKIPEYESKDLDDLFQWIILAENEPFFENYIKMYLEHDNLSIHRINKHGQNLLIFASEKFTNLKANHRMIETLLEHNPDLNLKDKKGNTALHYACKSKCLYYSSVHDLIKNGASLVLENDAGQNSFSIAVNNPEIDLSTFDFLVEKFKQEKFNVEFLSTRIDVKLTNLNN